VVYKHSSKPVDEYYVAYVKGWEVPDVDELLHMFVNSSISPNVQKSEIVAMEKFLNSYQRKYSKIYIKLVDSIVHSNELQKAISRFVLNRQKSARILIPSSSLLSNGSNMTTTSNNNYDDDSLLFKLRTIYFKNGLPIYRHNMISIIERTWKSKLNAKKFEGQNGLRVFVNLYEYGHYLTNKNEDVYGYRYTISINGEDPEFLGLKEPTYDDFGKQTDEEKSAVKFCPCVAYESDRLFIVIEPNIEQKINQILGDVWSELNGDKLIERISGKFKLRRGYFNPNIKELVRMSLTWLVDGSNPNPVFFKRPTVSDLMPYLRQHNMTVYDGIPLISKKIEKIVSLNSTENIRQELKVALMNAWRKANPELKEDLFYITFDNKPFNFVSSISSLSKSVNLVKRETANSEDKSLELNYYVGLNEKVFDASEINEPTHNLISKEIKSVIPNAKFENDIETSKGNDSSDTKNTNSNKFKNNLAILLVSVTGLLAIIIIISIIIATLIRRYIFRNFSCFFFRIENFYMLSSFDRKITTYEPREASSSCSTKSRSIN